MRAMFEIVSDKPKYMTIRDVGHTRHMSVTNDVEAETLRWMRTLGEALIMEAVEGRWFRGLRKSLQSFLEVSAHRVSGEVRFTLRNGAFDLAGLKAATPLYIRDREQWEYRKAAAARSVRASRFDGDESLDAGLEHRPNGEKALQISERLAHYDPNSTALLD